MVGWYESLHPWNRIVLTGLVVLLAARATVGNLTVELALATPLVAACLWASGWGVLSLRSRVRKLRAA
jgi:hypothetical protein